ncbi:PREDICTED: uncharacterized protein LOC106102657 isoform X1 [Papilio polytes]|uniref:uncharacterized protein LOC106102657 isoform X1 n=1 Tax=Papilio polytes TaxID=76194 RepID=UPI000676AEF9|nr:PREDICTED: uncharacterized protein LOC106102657 isoform X1 [Papilio polytes]
MASSDEQFSLCWNNFHANMSAGFHGLLSRGDLVDVTLAAEGRILQAHKLVLSVCSPYFQEMFKMNPNQHPIVFLKDVSHSALRDLLQFMYQGEVNVKQEELASFISTAEQLQVKGLTGNQNEESSTPSKPKPTSRPGPRSSQQRISAKLETDLDSKPSLTPVAIKRPNRPSIASNNSSSSQSGPAKRKCVDPLEAGPSGSAKDEFVTIPDEDENNAVAPKMEPEFVNESMWDDDDEGANNDETNFGEDDSNMEMSGFDGSATGDGNISGGGEGGAVGDAQDVLPEWVSIYFLKISEDEQKCNVCEVIIESDEKSLKLFHHIRDNHKEVHDIHKNSTEGAVGFQIEFLHLLKDDDPKTQPMVLGPVCETMISENKTEDKSVEDNGDLQFVLIPTKKKTNKKGPNRMVHENRRRSWVWKYFKKLSNIIYRCTLCNVVLSIKACNTNNMNRHVRARHPNIYKTEVGTRLDSDSEIPTEMDIPVSQSTQQIKVEDSSLIVEETDMDDAYYEALGQKQRRSWVWSYFNRVSKTLAQCKLCNRNICHGGNATGNMNRHLKMVHHKTGGEGSFTIEDNSWVWKVFDCMEDDFYSCKICQYKCMKFEDMERNVGCIMEHLKIEHGVVSGDQIVIDPDY